MIWRQLCHPNILPLFGIDESTFRPRLAMVSPWMGNGNILTYLQDNEDVDRLELVSSFFVHCNLEYLRTDKIDGIALGLRYLHAQSPPVVHGDLRGVSITAPILLHKCSDDMILSPISLSTIWECLGSPTSGCREFWTPN